MISVLSAVAEIERENILVQTMEGRRQKAREGKWNGGFAPYGYKLVDGELKIAEDDAEVIRIIFDKFTHTNMGDAGVVKYLAQQGISKKARQNGHIRNCHVTVKMNVPGATHVGGLIGTGLYYYGEETAFKIVDCSVNGEITGAVTPGSVAGRAENSIIESCEADVTLDGKTLEEEVGETDRMYESGDQGEEEGTETDEAA